MDKFCVQYKNLLRDIITRGEKRPDPNREGIYRHNLPFYDMTLDISDRVIPAITTKPLYWKGVVAELLWFLKGSTDIRDLWKDKVSIWDKDWYRHVGYNFALPLKEIKEHFYSNTPLPGHDSYFDLGPIYGYQWRETGSTEINDQFVELIKNIIENPLSSSHVIVAWRPDDISEMALPPCHWSFQVTCTPQILGLSNAYYLDLNFNMRSNDVLLGLPFNIASYALLTHVISLLCNNCQPYKNDHNKLKFEARYLKYSGVNVHLYDNQIEAALHQFERDATRWRPPTVGLNSKMKKNNHPGRSPIITSANENIELLKVEDFKLENYNSYGPLPGGKVEMLTYDK